jgi:hypothetical protein
MSTSQKAEVSVEFMIFVGILFVFFIFFFGIIGVKTRDINESTIFTDAQSVADKIADEINIAVRFEGYFREFYIPEKLVNGNIYSVVFHKGLRLVEVKWNGKSVMSSLVTENISGNISFGNNRIRNEEGVIVIEG